MLPPPGGDVEPVDAGASGSMPVCTASNWLDKTAPSVTLTRVASTQSPNVKLTILTIPTLAKSPAAAPESWNRTNRARPGP